MSTQRTPLPVNTDRPEPPAPPPAPPPAEGPAVDLTPEQVKEVEQKVIAVLHTCYDPEVPVNIYEMGLIYDVVVSPKGEVGIRMTLTSPACPVAGSLPGEVQAKVRGVPGVTSATVDVVWDPPWSKERMTDAAKLQLGLL